MDNFFSFNGCVNCLICLPGEVRWVDLNMRDWLGLPFVKNC